MIEETLLPFTEGALPTGSELETALEESMPATLADFRRQALARWAEREFGIESEEGDGFKRRVPRTLQAAAEQLEQVSGVQHEVCAARLRELLTRGSGLLREDGAPAFSFKLHQFIGQGGALYATLETVAQREFSMERPTSSFR